MDSVRFFVIALFLTLTAGCAEELAQLDKALAKAVEGVSDTDRITGKRVINLDNRAKQIAQADREAAALIANFKKKGIPLNQAADSFQYSRLLRIFKKVHNVSHLRYENWTPILIRDETENAFVNGGTYAFFHLGIMKTLDDDEVAAIVGHEIAHVAANHRFEFAAHVKLSKLAGSKSVKREHFEHAFGYKQEEEADRIGILYAALAGYAPNAAVNVWNKLHDDNAHILMRSHPVSSARMHAARETAAKVRTYYQPGKKNLYYASILKDNTLWQQKKPALETGKGGGLLAFAETIGNARAQHEQAKTEEQRQKQKVALITAAEQLTRIYQMQVISPNSLRISFTWNGNIPIGNIKMRTVLSGGQIAEKNTGGPLLPGKSYYIVMHFGNAPFASWQAGTEIPVEQIGKTINIEFIDAIQ